jgi:tRNA nucleotidyltransferase/poly(A) polymerase
MKTKDPRHAEALQTLRLLEAAGHKARLAGGCVRDMVMGSSPKDYDIATSARPEVVMKLLAGHQLKVIPTGIDHGTVTLVMPHGNIEITTLRRDVSTDGRRAVVSYDGATFEEDAARRDFTMNALYQDQTGKIYDFHGGLDDIKARRLAFVGDPVTRIREDYLRILRFFRFWARFDLIPQPAALDAIRAEQNGLDAVSAERITHELTELLGCKAIAAPLTAMHQTGVMAHVLPGFPNKVPLAKIIPALDALQPVTPPWRWQARLAVILYFASSETSELMRLKLSNKDRRAVLWGCDGFDAIAAAGSEVADLLSFVTRCDREAGHGSLHEWLHPVWTQIAAHFNEAARDERLSKINSALDAEKKFGARRTTPMPLTGKDVMETLGIYQGKRVGEILAALERAWLNGTWTTHAEGLALARTLNH